MKKQTKKIYKSDKNITWQKNQAFIQTAYVKLIKDLKRCPTILEVSQEVNLSITALNKHVKEMKFKTLENPLRSLTPDVLIAIYNSARKGSSASQKLWVQLMEGWREGIEVTGKEGTPLIPITSLKLVYGKDRTGNGDDSSPPETSELKGED